MLEKPISPTNNTQTINDLAEPKVSAGSLGIAALRIGLGYGRRRGALCKADRCAKREGQPVQRYKGLAFASDLACVALLILIPTHGWTLREDHKLRHAVISDDSFGQQFAQSDKYRIELKVIVSF